MFDWSKIDTVLLDMDGTLLDLHFDNHFWLEHVPKRYAQAQGLGLDAAKSELMSKYQDIAGTLEWYCVDHWSRELGLDIALLKEEVAHLIQVHPHVLDFLAKLGRMGKKRVLVTNAHQKSLALKLKRTPLSSYLDQICSAHELGLPKEHGDFWGRLQKLAHFDPLRTLFVDDSLAVLDSARRYGIRHLLRISRPDRKLAAKQVGDYMALEDFSALL